MIKPESYQNLQIKKIRIEREMPRTKNEAKFCPCFGCELSSNCAIECELFRNYKDFRPDRKKRLNNKSEII